MVKQKVDGTLPASSAQRQRFTGKRCNLYLIYIRNTSVSKQKNKAQFLLKKCHYGQIWSVNAVKHCEFCWMTPVLCMRGPPGLRFPIPRPYRYDGVRERRRFSVPEAPPSRNGSELVSPPKNLGSTRVETQKGIRYKKMRNRETQGWKAETIQRTSRFNLSMGRSCAA